MGVDDATGTGQDATHTHVEGHRHRHDRWCGHPTLLHDDHLDFLHDGQVHHPCSDDVDVMSSGADTVHLSHSAHMHVHQDECGHKAVTHDDHVDFMHGQHRHASHHSHYDEH